MIVSEQAIRAMQTVVLGDGDVTSGHVPSVEDCRVVIEAVAPFLESDAQARIDKALEWTENEFRYRSSLGAVSPQLAQWWEGRIDTCGTIKAILEGRYLEEEGDM